MTDRANFYVAGVNRALQHGDDGLALELVRQYGNDADPPSTPRGPLRRLLTGLDTWTLHAFNAPLPRNDIG